MTNKKLKDDYRQRIHEMVDVIVDSRLSGEDGSVPDGLPFIVGMVTWDTADGGRGVVCRTSTRAFSPKVAPAGTRSVVEVLITETHQGLEAIYKNPGLEKKLESASQADEYLDAFTIKTKQ